MAPIPKWGYQPISPSTRWFYFNRGNDEGWLTGGIEQTQEHIIYSAENNIIPQIEGIDANKGISAWEKVANKEACYR